MAQNRENSLRIIQTTMGIQRPDHADEILAKFHVVKDDKSALRNFVDLVDGLETLEGIEEGIDAT